MSSLPVPLSPVTSTLALLGPTCATRSSTACIFGSLAHDVPEGVALAQAIAELPRLLDQPRLFHRALDDGADNASDSRGLVR